MDRVISSFMGALLVCAILVFDLVLNVSGNAEGDALNAFKTSVADPNSVLQSWDATLVNPCTWFHVTCNTDNSVTRVDLGNANLSGELVAQLGQLPNLQYLNYVLTTLAVSQAYARHQLAFRDDYINERRKIHTLELYNNSITGKIPAEFGNLTNLVSLDLYTNRISGSIPETLGNLKKLRFLHSYCTAFCLFFFYTSNCHQSSS